MVKREFTFPSADGKTAIHAVEWLPEGAPRAVLQIAHGVSEYVLRYEDFAGYLTERGFAVVGNDHLGHGLSVSDGAPRLYFGPKGSWNWVVEDMEQLRKLTHRQFPNLPYFLLGHSMGSFLTRTYLIRYPGTVDGAIIMGTGYMSAASTAASLAVINAECLRNGESRPSAVATKASFGIYNRRFAPNRTSMDWLSLNPDNVDAYLKDPLCQGNASAGLFREMLSGIRFVCKEDNIRKMNHHTPILFISGAKYRISIVRRRDCGPGEISNTDGADVLCAADPPGGMLRHRRDGPHLQSHPGPGDGRPRHPLQPAGQLSGCGLDHGNENRGPQAELSHHPRRGTGIG